MKKIGILTLGLKDNYGGILQAIALYVFLKKNGFDPILIRKYRYESRLKNLLRRFFEMMPIQNFRGIRLTNIKFKENLQFWSKYIDNQTQIFTKKDQVSEYACKNLDAVIVGSDQVWRYSYINDGAYDVFFLNFEFSGKKIAYAASFGINKWEQPKYNSDIHNYLLDFDSISVREQSGVEICKQSFNIDNVSWVLDPTLLIGADFFKDMIKNEKNEKYDSIDYILDRNEQKIKIIDGINEKYKNISNVNLLTESSTLSIAEWVSKFSCTKMVVTDSFHGMVFSILFEKEFFVIVNKERGADRFISLCKELDLLDRLIDISDENLDLDLIRPLDYMRINNNLKELRKASREFLIRSLNF